MQPMSARRRTSWWCGQRGMRASAGQEVRIQASGTRQSKGGRLPKYLNARLPPSPTLRSPLPHLRRTIRSPCRTAHSRVRPSESRGGRVQGRPPARRVRPFPSVRSEPHRLSAPRMPLVARSPPLDLARLGWACPGHRCPRRAPAPRVRACFPTLAGVIEEDRRRGCRLGFAAVRPGVIASAGRGYQSAKLVVGPRGVARVPARLVVGVSVRVIEPMPVVVG
jgi:hypothetical protein